MGLGYLRTRIVITMELFVPLEGDLAQCISADNEEILKQFLTPFMHAKLQSVLRAASDYRRASPAGKDSRHFRRH